MSAADTPAIEIRNLVRRYGRTDAVNGLSLTVTPGRCYGFFGRNGAGKTTTIKCLLNLLRPSSGQISVFGMNALREDVAVKSRLAYVPDVVGFYPWMTVQAFTSNVSAATVSVLDIPGRKLITTVSTGAGNQRMTVSPDDKWFVTNIGQGSKMSFFRTSDYQLDFDIPLDGAPFVSRFSPDGKSIYNMGNAPRGATPAGIRVWKADVASKKVVAMSADNLGTGTGGIQVSPFNGRVYLSAYSGQVSVLDPDTLKVVKQFPTPMTPDGLFFGRVR